MKASNLETGHNRTIKISDIKDSELSELLITVDYVKNSNDGNTVAKAVVLDKFVIPEIIRSINKKRSKSKKPPKITKQEGNYEVKITGSGSAGEILLGLKSVLDTLTYSILDDTLGDENEFEGSTLMAEINSV